METIPIPPGRIKLSARIAGGAARGRIMETAIKAGNKNQIPIL
jgi:hypothetical protein